MENDRQTNTVELAIAVMAAAITVSFSKGPYNLFSTAIGIALITLILSCESNRKKTSRESAAFASVLAIALILVLGVCLEPYCQWLGFPNNDGSYVDENGLALLWLLAALVVYGVDTRIWPWKPRSRKKEPLTQTGSSQ